MTRTAEQRHAYIGTSRRSQPIAELERKAAKARGRHGGWGESADLSLAIWHAKDLARWATPLYANPPTGVCWSCSTFGTWDKAQNRYVAPPVHKPRCCYAPDDGPYPGWTAAGRRPTPTTAAHGAD